MFSCLTHFPFSPEVPETVQGLSMCMIVKEAGGGKLGFGEVQSSCYVYPRLTDEETEAK